MMISQGTRAAKPTEVRGDKAALTVTHDSVDDVLDLLPSEQLLALWRR